MFENETFTVMKEFKVWAIIARVRDQQNNSSATHFVHASAAALPFYYCVSSKSVSDLEEFLKR